MWELIEEIRLSDGLKVGLERDPLTKELQLFVEEDLEERRTLPLPFNSLSLALEQPVSSPLNLLLGLRDDNGVSYLYGPNFSELSFELFKREKRLTCLLYIKTDEDDAFSDGQDFPTKEDWLARLEAIENPSFKFHVDDSLSEDFIIVTPSAMLEDFLPHEQMEQIFPTLLNDSQYSHMVPPVDNALYFKVLIKTLMADVNANGPRYLDALIKGIPISYWNLITTDLI